MTRLASTLAALSLTALASAAQAATAPRCSLKIASDADLAGHPGFADMPAGATVCIAPGTYRRQLTIAGIQATASTPVSFVVWPDTGPARFTAGVLLRGASGVTVAGLDVTQDARLGPGSSVTIDVGSHDNVVRGLTVHDAYVGISIGSSAGAAGPGNQVLENVVRDSWNTGIAVGELSDGTAQDANLIARNRVTNSGGHGIEINDSNYIAVRDNIVSGSGTGVNSVRQGGYSGIHLYSREASTPGSPHGIRTAHDLISGNHVDGTHERPATQHCDDGSGSGACTDGNGIQVDRFASFDDVIGNTVSGNAGAGISIYGASNNRVLDNIVRGNNQQVERRRYFPGPGEIAVSAVNLPSGSTRGNTIARNTATTTVNKIPAFYLSTNAGPNQVESSNRWLQDEQSNPGYFWGPVYIGDKWYSASDATRVFDELSGAKK